MMDGDQDPVAAIALTMVPRVGDVHARILMEQYGSATAVFAAARRELEAIPGIGTVRAASIRSFRNFQQAESEWKWTRHAGVEVIVQGSPKYPRRLTHCTDAPLVLYGKGDTSDRERVVAVIGTRKPSAWCVKATHELLKGLSSLGIQVVSGLAQGIDTEAHRTALNEGLHTIGVLGHGLDILYPPSNARLARDMMTNGGLLTEFRNGTLPDAQNFPKRNRIVAGLADAVLVVETGVKGGSMITARLAFGYDRDIFALPGRPADENAMGCHRLIQENKAMLVTSAEDIVKAMNWDLAPPQKSARQPALFVDLSPEEERIMTVLRESAGPEAADDIALRSGLRTSQASALLLGLEMKGLIRTLPGKRYASD
jgi:DNA processing protein